MKKIKIYVLLIIIFSIIFEGCENKQEQEIVNNGDVFNEIINENQIIWAVYHTENDDYSAGTAFCIQTDYSENPILVTAYHLFGSAGGLDVQLKSDEIAEYVSGGELLDMFSTESTGAEIQETIIIKDAESVPKINKDVIAFKLKNTENLNPLKLSNVKCKKGENVYLLADLWDNENKHENGVYKGTCVNEEDGILYYNLEGDFSTTGASGAPIVNDRGEVVAMHIASNDEMKAGHSASHFNEMIKDSIE